MVGKVGSKVANVHTYITRCNLQHWLYRFFIKEMAAIFIWNYCKWLKCNEICWNEELKKAKWNIDNLISLLLVNVIVLKNCWSKKKNIMNILKSWTIRKHKYTFIHISETLTFLRGISKKNVLMYLTLFLHITGIQIKYSKFENMNTFAKRNISLKFC